MSKPEVLKLAAPADTASKSLEERVMEQCCSYHIGMEGLRESDKPINFLLTGRGAMKVMKNKIGIFVSKTDDVPGLPNISEGLLLSVPKIPYYMFTQTISFFRAVMKKYDDAEAMVQFYYDEENKSYVVHCPDQIVSGAHIDFKRSQEFDDKYILVMDIHSHNTMGAFFSGTDNADEQETRIFGVLGKLNNDIPEMKFRISVGGAFKEINIFDIFESPFPATDFPEEWLEKCTKRSVTTYYGAGRSTWPSYTTGRTGYTGIDDDYSYPGYIGYEYSDYTRKYDSKYDSKSEYKYDRQEDAVDLEESIDKIEDLVTLVREVLAADAEAVALAIIDECLEDDIIAYLQNFSITRFLEKDRTKGRK